MHFAARWKVKKDPRTVITFFLFVLVLLLGAVIGVGGPLFLKERTKAAELAAELESHHKESGLKIGALNEDVSKYKQAYAGLRTKAENEIKRLRAESKTLLTTISSQKEKMQRWQVIVDAEAEADRVRAEGEANATRLQEEADQLLVQAKATAAEIISKAEVESQLARQRADQLSAEAENDSIKIRDTARRETELQITSARRDSDALKLEATKLLEEARTRANRVMAEAEIQAKEIAGEAYEIKQDIGKYERILRAIKNELEGYGDEYIVPSHNLLDELADEFAFADAGQKLKDARNLVKSMVKTGKAATCDYVEANRRETAIRFVVDAFNGKVDSILAIVKHDNYGKLNQQIKDAFMIVNSNGGAFRNARITEEYLNARIDELKWAVTANELKKRDQEEQRLAKEKIREEQKVKRECERALREAKREEDAIQKAMARLQEQILTVAADERSRYEVELQALQEKLKIAEEKGQRAISMAQQTRCGHVYIISNVGSFGENVYKIGLTRRLEPLDRVRELGDSSVPFEFDVHSPIKSDDAPALEHQLHRHFLLRQVNKVNHRKEFFRCDLETIRREVEALGLNSQWTMRAEARSYRETLVIDKKIASDPIAREQWLQRQLELELTEENEELLEVGADEDNEA